ncbi:MAG: hypothetical protein QM479_13930 [Pseudomonadota bacterium]
MISKISNTDVFNQQLSEMRGAEKESGKKISEEEFQKKAQSMGVPADVIKQGRQAVKEWVMESRQTTDENSSTPKKDPENDSDSGINIFA